MKVNALAALGKASRRAAKTDPKIIDPKDPSFKNRDEHDAYHTEKLLEKSKNEKPGFYNEYFKLRDSGDVAGSQAMLAAMGGLPAYSEPKKVKTSTPVDWQKLGFNPKKSGGYRYNSGDGKPSIGSITQRK